MIWRHWFIFIFSFCGFLCLAPLTGNADSPMMGGVSALDARSSLPSSWFWGKSYTDGLFLDHAEIPNLGIYAQIGGIYQYKPFGEEPHRQLMVHRFLTPLGIHIFLFKWVDVSLVLPFSLYQYGFNSEVYPNVASQAVGDLSLGGKVRIPLPTQWVHLATSVRLGFDTATKNSYLGAGQVNGGVNIVLQSTSFFQKRLSFVTNIGFFMGGNNTPCLSRLPIAGTPTPPLMPTGCDERGLGLGKHITYGVGISALVWKFVDPVLKQEEYSKGLFLDTELLGSFAFVDTGTKMPGLWTLGLRAKFNQMFYGSLAYGVGLNASSPSHTVMAQFGFAWHSGADGTAASSQKFKME